MAQIELLGRTLTRLAVLLLGLLLAGCMTAWNDGLTPPVEVTYNKVAPAATVTPLPAATTPPATPLPVPSVPPSPALPTPGGGLDRVQVYLVALADNGQHGPKIGCDDSLVAVEREISPTRAPLRAALDELLGLREQYYGQSGLYNALYQSTLAVEQVSLDEQGRATIHLTGRLQLGGVCDAPRLQAQLEQTARQFTTVKEVAIFVEGVPLAEALSLK